MKKWDEMDYKILNLLQNRFPMSLVPFQDMALQVGLTEEEVINRIARMREDGLIRRVGGIINSHALGFYSTLCACRVAEDRIEEVGRIINGYSQVTHNYVRDHHQYNLWFTLTAKSREEALKTVAEMERRTDTSIANMPAQKVYKIKVSFEMGHSHALQ